MNAMQILWISKEYLTNATESWFKIFYLVTPANELLYEEEVILRDEALDLRTLLLNNTTSTKPLLKAGN